MRIILPAIVTLFLFYFCTGKKGTGDKYEEARVVYRQALKVHDEVMPRMGEIVDLQKQLNEKKTGISDSVVIEQLDNSIRDLETSHHNMMDWMRNIPDIPGPEDEPDANDQSGSMQALPSPDEVKSKQEESLQRIIEVQNEINTSIREANDLIGSINR